MSAPFFSPGHGSLWKLGAGRSPLGFEAMAGVRDSSASGKFFESNTHGAFPQFPGEDFQAHSAAQYKEQIDARLADLGLLAVAQGHDPASVKSIIDYDISVLPVLASTHRDFVRTQETRMKWLVFNASNEEKRQALRFESWTKVYTLFKVSTETSAPVLSRELLQKCDIQVLHGLPGGYFDGPRAYRIIVKRLAGGSRTQGRAC